MIPDINLLPHVGKSESNSKLIYSIIAAVTVVILIILAWRFVHVKQDIAYLSSQQQLLQAQRDQLLDQSNSLVGEETDEFATALEFVERVSYAVSPLMDEISKLLLPHTYLREYTFGDNVVTIVVDFETIADISQYTAQLISSKYFSDVQMNAVEAFEVNVGDSSFNEAAVVDELDFNQLPRYEANMTLFIDEQYLAAGGAR